MDSEDPTVWTVTQHCSGSFCLPAGFLQEVGTVRHRHGKSPTQAPGHIGGVEDSESDLEKIETTGTPLCCTRPRRQSKDPKQKECFIIILVLF